MDYKFSVQVNKFLKKCDDVLYDRISNKIIGLLENPNPHDSKCLKTSRGKLFRVRVGDVRIIYEIDWEKDVIIILFIEKRSKVYGYVREEFGLEFGEGLVGGEKVKK